MNEVTVGQVYEDCGHIFHPDSLFAVIVCSKEPGEDWKCMEFQEWQFGMYERFYDEMSLQQMKLKGNVSDLRDKL